MHADRLIGLLLLPLLAVSCVDRLGTQDVAAGGLVPVQLAFSLQKEDLSTKAIVSVVSEMGDTPVFRGMDSIRILPFDVSRDIDLNDHPLYFARSMSSISNSHDTAAYFGGGVYHTGLVEKCNAHLYPDASIALPKGTASVLVYGQAPRRPVTGLGTEQQVKHRFGSLIAEGLHTISDTEAAETIHFRPDPISTLSSDNSLSAAIASILTEIAYTSYTPDSGPAVSWSTIVDPTLQQYYYGITRGGAVMPGSGRHVLGMINALYENLCQYTSDDPSCLGLKGAILQKYTDLVSENMLVYDSDADTYSYYVSDLLDYPVSLGLPEGASLLRWDGRRFHPVTEQEFEALASMIRFCYMPSLYYFVNSTVKTDVSREIYKKYTKENNWNQILSQYTLGNEVDDHTHAVALVEPLQFACSKCVLTIRAKTEQLLDRKGVSCDATGPNFPVVGIIIASQFTQAFDFTPETNGTEYSMYDNDFYADGHATSFLKYYDATGLATQPKLQTLVLPTPVGQDVYFCVELRNDSGVAFTGAEGIVMPGTCFYLIGKLDLDGKPLNQVFIPDSYTTISCVVESLENAHICVPELRIPQLTLGVQTELNWIMAQPAQIPLR